MTETSFDAIQAQIQKKWKSLTISNDFVFCKTMLNTELCRDVLEAILGVPIDRLDYIGRQEQLDASPEGKAVRLDVYVRDDAGTVYNVEMQSTDTHELPQRSRYYHALMAVDQLTKGALYKELKNSYVIFLCTFDPFKQGQRVYSFENMCRGLNTLALNDGMKTVFLSASAPERTGVDDRLNELLDYVATGKVTGTLSSRLATEVASVLDNEKWRLEYMMLEVRDQLNFDRGILQGRAEGLAEGEKKGRAEGLAEGKKKGREAGLAEGERKGREAGLAEGERKGREAGLAEGERKGREAGLAEGERKGRAEGLAEGEERLARLVAALMNEDKATEVPRILTDLNRREELYRTYNLL